MLSNSSIQFFSSRFNKTECFWPWQTGKVITKTYLCNFNPLKPHFYIVKLGFTGVYTIFLISAQKHRLWVLIRTAEAVLTSTHNLCFEQKYEKYQNILSENFQFLVVKFSIYLNRRVFIMALQIAQMQRLARIVSNYAVQPF